MTAQHLLSLKTGNLTFGGVNYPAKMILKRFGRLCLFTNESLSLIGDSPLMKPRIVFNEARICFQSNVFLN